MSNDNITTYPAGQQGPIGIFDSGFGGLTILKEIRRALPDRDYLFLGDNARAPYGIRSFELVYEFTLQAVRHLFACGCPLVILACNTASAKALRSIQQNDLPTMAPDRRVLGVIRPTAEAIGSVSRGKVGIMATPGTVSSHSYDMEIAKLFPGFEVYSQACPMLVPLVENNEIDSPATAWFIDKYLGQLRAQCADIDTIILGCTHYPLLYDQISHAAGDSVNVLRQGEIVAQSTADYLRRHPEIDSRITRNATCRYLTTENSGKFADFAGIFIGENVSANHVTLS